MFQFFRKTPKKITIESIVNYPAADLAKEFRKLSPEAMSIIAIAMQPEAIKAEMVAVVDTKVSEALDLWIEWKRS